MSTRVASLGVLLFVGALIIFGSIFIVNEAERGVIVRFGEVVDDNLTPGLKFKIPIIESARLFDGRVQVLDAKPGEFLTAEKKRLIVDSFVMWKIKDVNRFYVRTQGDSRVAQRLMSPRINDGLKDKIASRTLTEVVSGERGEIMVELRDQVNTIVDQELGIEIVDIRIKQVEFSSAVSEEVYNRMRAERNKDAQEHRSEGNEKAEAIKADADRQESVILAEAYREAEKIKGEGDATAASLYAKAYGRDPKFYEFTRSLKAYRQTFNSKTDIMVIDPDSEFFNYMNKARGEK